MPKNLFDGVLDNPIAVLGAGAWGTALAVLLASNNQSVRLWDHDTERLKVMQAERNNPWSLPGVAFPKQITVCLDFSESVRDVTDICMVVPSHAFCAVLQKLKTQVASPRIMWGTKGLDPNSGEFLHLTAIEIFSDKIPLAVLSGPSFAKEVALRSPTAVSIASNNAAFAQSLSQRFQNKYFRVALCDDVVGVQLAGVLKNVLAIAVGMLDGMGFGSNTRCAFITDGLNELATFSKALGGSRDTTLSLAGVGDTVLTCTDNQSRNRRFGMAIGQGKTAEIVLKEIGESVEGYYNAKQLSELARRHHVSVPIIDAVHAILYENRNPTSLLSVIH